VNEFHRAVGFLWDLDIFIEKTLNSPPEYYENKEGFTGYLDQAGVIELAKSKGMGDEGWCNNCQIPPKWKDGRTVFLAWDTNPGEVIATAWSTVWNAFTDDEGISYLGFDWAYALPPLPTAPSIPAGGV